MAQLRNLVNNEELKRRLRESKEARITLSFYRYHQIKNPEQFRDHLYRDLSSFKVYGRIYVAHEGLNGQISVPNDQLLLLRDYLYGFSWMDGMRLNIAIEDDGKSFYKLKIKIRPKIVADGLDDQSFDVTRRGKHLSAEEVNTLLSKEETVIVDMRNHYESEVGHFKAAICPDVETFREALSLVEEMLQDDKDKPIIMYCTGGIRCEKASAYYLHKGFENVYMIDGGIIEYSRQCTEKGLENHFIGKNFVFDERMGERISEDVISSCHLCGTPSDRHTNCANDACHLLHIQCPECAEKYQGCCSQECADFMQLPEEERERLKPTMIFNGMRFKKGRLGKERREYIEENT